MDKLINKNKGFTTLEIMIALALMALILTAVVLVSFGNQSSLISSQTSNEAMKLAQDLIEEEQALGRKDFNLVNSTTAVNDDIYKKNVVVKLLPDFVTKEVKAIINWKGERGLDKNLELTTLVTNFDSPTGSNTCNSDLSGDWSNPEIENLNHTDFGQLIGDNSGTYTITDVDAYKEKLYVTVGQTTNITDKTLFIFDISGNHKSNPELLDSIDNSTTVIYGLNAVRVAEDTTDNSKVFAYAASNTNSNYGVGGCNPATNTACGQLYIFDVSNPNNIPQGKNLKISSNPPVTGQSATGQVKGQSIYYRNNYVFLGLQKTDGPEFHILDVHNPSSINSGSFPSVGSFEVNNGINAIVVRHSFAYLATPNTQELQILNIANPLNPTPGNPAYGFNSTDGQDGKNLYLVGDKLYFTKTEQLPSGTNDFYILDNTNPASVLNSLGGVDFGMSVNSVIVRDYLAFLLTNTKLEIYNINNPSTPIFVNHSISVNNNGTSPSMDCEDNRIYISSNNNLGKGSIYVIKPNE